MIAFRRHLDEASLAEVADVGTRDHLTPAERLHLDSCDRCRGLVNGHQRASRLLSASWRLIPAAELVGSGVTAVRPRVGLGSALRTSDSRTGASWLRLAVVLGAALLLVVAGLLVASSRPPLPTSTRLTFSFEAGLISVNTDGSGVESIVLGDGCCLRDPTWSPDGGQLAFVRGETERAQLVIVAADSPAEPKVVGEVVPQLYGDFEWSPDGRLLAGWDEQRGFVVVDAETGERLRALPLTFTSGMRLSWSPDGSRILLKNPILWDNWGRGAGHLVVLDVAAAPEALRYFAKNGNEFDISHGAWSPDGSRFVVYTGRVDRDSGAIVDPRVLVMDQEGDPPRELAAGRNPTWSPDGAFIAFERTDFGLSIIRPDGSGLRFIDDGLRPSWSPDGRQLAYCGVERSGWFVADAMSWEPRLVYETVCRYEGLSGWAAWQPTQQGD